MNGTFDPNVMFGGYALVRADANLTFFVYCNVVDPEVIHNAARGRTVKQVEITAGTANQAGSKAVQYFKGKGYTNVSVHSVHTGRTDAADTSYKGYLIKHNPTHGEYHVSKGGSHIATYKSVDAAKRGIDELVG